MGLKVTNNAYGTLNASITSSSTTIVLNSGEGARFPTLSAGDYFYATLIDTSNNLEVVKVTARSTDTLTVVRGQDNTTARAYATNDRFELRPTAVMLNEIITTAEGALPKAGGTLTGRTIVSVSTGKQLTLAQWGDASSADGGQTMVAGNAYFDKSSGAAKFSNSHGTIGATGIRFNSPSWNEGSLFTAGVVGSTAENTFTPVDALIWDTAGRVRMPLQPAFSAVGSGVQSWSGGSATQVLQLAYKTGGIAAARSAGYNTSTYRFTAPVAGVYAFYHGYTITSAGTGPESYLYVNGTTVYHMGAIGYQYSGGYNTSVAVQLINLNANDYVDVRIQNNNNVSFSIDLGRSYFGGYLIG